MRLVAVVSLLAIGCDSSPSTQADSGSADAVTDVADSSATPADSVVDATPEPSGTAIWSRAFGPGGHEAIKGVTADPAANVIVVGTITKNVEFDGRIVSSAGKVDALVAKLDPAGKVQWVERYGDGQDQSADAVATDSAGNIYVCGNHAGTVALGGKTAPLVNGGVSTNVFVAKLAPSGEAQWSKQFGNNLYFTMCNSIAIDGAGRILLTGQMSGSIDFGGGEIASPIGPTGVTPAAFVVELDPSGNHLWSRAFGAEGEGAVAGHAIAPLPGGGAAVAAFLQGTIDIGGTKQTSAGESDGLVFVLDGKGDPRWSRRFGGAKIDSAGTVAVTASGDVLVGGFFDAYAELAGAAVTSVGERDGFVIALAGASGAPLWRTLFPGPKEQIVMNVGVDAKGNVFASGKLAGSMDLGAGPLVAKGEFHDVFVARLDPAGKHVWSRNYGEGTTQAFPRTMYIDPTGAVLVAGDYWGTIDFGAGSLPESDGWDLWVAKLAP